MESENWKQISRIFDYVHTLSPDERTTLIKELCSDDPELEREILELLSLHETSAHYFEEHLQKNKNLFQNLVASFEDQKPGYDIYTGQTMGQWQLDELLGRGGMGTVYKAKRVSLTGVSQTGAFKIIHKSLATPGHVERFKLEQQILAKLNHPNIAAFIDSGITPDGIPYMVMEYVEGKNLLEYCDEKKLGIEQRLELFNSVCGAIQYAHSNLVVHRDLKPQNILVTRDGYIKILDFGIAKLLYPHHDEFARIETLPGGRLMSLEYASPEQVSGDQITTSSDLYSLGMLLYTLLCGLHPFHFAGLSFKQIETAILETDPPPPGKRFEKADAREKATIAMTRQQQPAGLFRYLKGDLDAIILKALRKEPKQRYDSVSHLTDDIRRYQNALPVYARAGNVRYRLVKFAKRNRTAMISAACFLIAITAFGGYHFNKIAGERDISRIEAEKATRVKDFVINLFDANDPYFIGNRGDEITVRSLLEAGLLNIERDLAGEPEVYAEMHNTMGNAFYGLRELSRAKTSLHTSLNTLRNPQGEHLPIQVTSMVLLSRVYLEEGKRDSAEIWLQRAIDINVNGGAERRPKLVANYTELGTIYARSRNFDDAVAMHKKALVIAEETGTTDSYAAAMAHSSLGDVLTLKGDLEEAEAHLLTATEKLEEIVGESHISIANIYGSLAGLYRRKSDFSGAEAWFDKSIELKNRLYGENHPGKITTLANYGDFLRTTGKYEAAEQQLEEAIRLFHITGQADSLTYSTYLNNLALAKAALGKTDQAAALHDEILSIKRRFLEPDNPSITITLYNKAVLYHSTGHYLKARELFEEVVERDKQRFGPDHREVGIDLVKLGAVYRDLLDFENANQTFLEANPIFETQFAPNHHRRGEFYLEYGRLRVMESNCDAAIPMLENSISIFEEHFDDDYEQLGAAREHLARCSSFVEQF